MNNKTKCDYCNKQIIRSNRLIKESFHHFCCYKCFLKWKIKIHRHEIVCFFCKKTYFINKRDLNKSKHNFCSIKCYTKFKKIKRRFIFCFRCNKKVWRVPAHIKRSKHNFCSNKCRALFLSYKNKRYISCKFCKNKFLIKKYRLNSNKEYFFCSNKCYYKFRIIKYRKSIKCFNCKKIFKATQYYVNHHKKFFCSNKCYKKYSLKIVKCLHCDKKIKVIRSYLKLKRDTFCSKKCKQLFKIKKYTVFCAICRNKIILKPGVHVNHKYRLCSKECYIIFQSKRMKGKNNPAWIDGMSDDRYRKQYPLEFNNNLRDFIRKRDQYKCQNENCGIPQKECFRKLNCHHIDYNKKNNDPINLIALCEKDHTKSNYNRKYWQEYYENIQIKRKVHLIESYIK